MPIKYPQELQELQAILLNKHMPIYKISASLLMYFEAQRSGDKYTV